MIEKGFSLSKKKMLIVENVENLVPFPQDFPVALTLQTSLTPDTVLSLSSMNTAVKSTVCDKLNVF